MLSRLSSRAGLIRAGSAVAPGTFAIQQRHGSFTEADMPIIKRKWEAAEKVGAICLSMKNVAAGALPSVEAALGNARAFGLTMKNVLALEEDPAIVQNVVHLVVGVERGLCGALSSNTVRAVDKVIAADPKKQHQVVVIGKRSASVAKAVMDRRLRSVYSESKTKFVPFEVCTQIAEYLLYELDNWDKCVIYYNQYKNILEFGMKEPTIVYNERISRAIHSYQLFGYDGEYALDLVVENMIEFKLASAIYLALAENGASEQASRLRSMGAAVESTEEMCQEYMKIYQDLRKDKITNELTLVVAAKKIAENQAAAAS